MKIILYIWAIVNIINESTVEFLSDLCIFQDLLDNNISDHFLMIVPPKPIVILKMGSDKAKANPKKTDKDSHLIDMYPLKSNHSFISQPQHIFDDAILPTDDMIIRTDLEML